MTFFKKIWDKIHIKSQSKFHDKTDTFLCNYNVVIFFYYNRVEEVYNVVITTIFRKFFPGRPLSPRRGGGGGGPVLAGRHRQGVVQQPQQLAVALGKAWKGKGGICKGVRKVFFEGCVLPVLSQRALICFLSHRMESETGPETRLMRF